MNTDSTTQLELTRVNSTSSRSELRVALQYWIAINNREMAGGETRLSNPAQVRLELTAATRAA
jgi:hypothetical protein